MRINLENKSMDMELRDWNYLMSAYLRSYLFHSSNVIPEKIIFPMFRQVKHPREDTFIPVEYVPDDSPIAIEVIGDGSNVPEATEEQIAEADRKDEEIGALKAEIKRLTEGGPEEPIQTKPVTPVRPPKQPDHPLPAGTPLDDMGPRDRGDQKRIAKDLAEQPDIDEEKEIPTEIKKPEEK